MNNKGATSFREERGDLFEIKLVSITLCAADASQPCSSCYLRDALDGLVSQLIHIA